MDILFQIALIVLPAGAVLLTAIFFLRKSIERDLLTSNIEMKKERQTFFLPLRVDAYQRAILLMERVHPNSLVMRMNNPGMPAAAMQVKFLEAIREEYEHNIAQQMYISPQSWELVKKAKEETIKVINMAGQQMTATSMAMDLNSKIFEITAEVGELPSEIAVKILKEEIQRLF